MGKVLSDKQVAAYHRDGYASPVRAMDAATAAAYRRRFEAYEAANGGWYELSKGAKLYLLQTWVTELVLNQNILDAVEDLLGPDLFCWGTSLFVKDSHNPGFVSWHQDATYWGLDKPDVVTAWVALSPATEVSGCMKVIPGSHQWNQIAHRDTLAKENLLTRGQEIAVDVNEDEAVLMPLQPGEVSLHHVLAAHASEPNRSDDRRIGVAIRYVAPHVRQINGDRDAALLVRGEDRYGHFMHEKAPKADMDAEAVAEHKRILEFRQSVLYKGVAGQPAHTKV
jgi:ectoine hydroxylase-related dioxygenase (phytanoyl-CoA dioxygenase family)